MGKVIMLWLSTSPTNINRADMLGYGLFMAFASNGHVWQAVLAFALMSYGGAVCEAYLRKHH